MSKSSTLVNHTRPSWFLREQAIQRTDSEAYPVLRDESVTVLLVGFMVVILTAELLAPQFVNHLLVPGLPPYERTLTITLTRIMLLHSLILGLGTVATAILNSKQQFLLPALAIAIYDFGLIGGLLVSFAFPHVGIYGPTVGLLISAFCQVGVLIPALLKQGVRYSFLWNLKHPGLREVMGLLIPNLIAIGVGSITGIVDTAFPPTCLTPPVKTDQGAQRLHKRRLRVSAQSPA